MNLMFQPQFEPLILSGRKPHTIRPKRKIPLKVGQPLSLRVWTGKPYRSPQREFMKAVVEKVWPASIHMSHIIVNSIILGTDSEKDFAWSDGFADADCLRNWFLKTHGLPFEGEVIYWRCA